MSEQLIQTPGVFGENGNFLLERELGAGGMGGVYMGRDKMLDRPVAVKVMLKEYGSDPEFVEKFKKEAQSAARLIHPNIAQVYSYGICDGMPYIAMELACGGSLYSIMQANPGKADVTRVLKICQQVAQALQCANDQGCVHGDVKPENILLDANGNAKLVDFGLAGMQKNTDEIWGTPYYISPEKVKKEPIDFRADMYSLGGTLYHALTGVAPFEGEDSIAVVKARFLAPPKKPSEIRPDLTPAIDALVMKMLALNKEDRYPSFEALLDAFKGVLTSGLTRNITAEAEAATAGEKKPATAATTATRGKMVMRGRRTMAMKRRGMTVKKDLESGEQGDEGALDETEKPKTDEDEDEDEKGGNLLVKVLIFAVVGILVLAGIGGGLWWYVVADKKAKAADVQNQVAAGFKKARTAVDDTVANAKKFADEFDEFAKKAIDACEKPTKELAALLPAEQAKLLKPDFSKELLDAIAATNEAPKAEAAAPAGTNAVAAAGTNAAPAKAAAPAGTNAAPAKAAAPAAKPPAPAKDAKGQPAPAAKPAPAAPAKDAKAAELPPAVVSMRELWDRAYGCQASAVRIRHAVRQLVKKGAEGDGIAEVSEENARVLGKLSVELAEALDTIKTSKDVENVRKGITYIKTRGEKLVEQTTKRLRIEKLESDRKAKAEAAAAAEKERQEKKAAEHQAQVDAETKTATDKFDTLVAQGVLRQMDWKNALRQLEAVKAELKTPEGVHAADIQIRKVNDMKKMQDVFVKSVKDHVFKGKLKGAKVASVSEKELNLDRGKSKARIPWHKFYKSYPGNLNELINQYIVRGRENAKPKLNLKDWADAMTGAALTMQLVCSEVNGAVEKGEQLAKAAVKDFPSYARTAKEIFPDIEFPAATEEE
jgi:hypothetical protein